jgi:hypothetical protein
MGSQERLVEALETLVGRSCWRRVAGGSAGSHVSLDFEPSGPRAAIPEYAVLVRCSWRLDSEFEVICGAWDDNGEGGTMLKGLDRLVGQRLGSFNLTAPGMDLELRFADCTLRIFCDNVNKVDSDDNYSVFLPGEVVTVATRSRIEWEPISGSVNA